MAAVRPIVFCSDYGLTDPFVGICHGVIARIAPAVPVIDLGHLVPPQDVMRGALLLAQSAPFFPRDAVVLAIVDPGVGMARRPAVVETSSGATLVGPDNGLLSLAWRELGGASRAFEITAPDVMLTPVSETFHGRDIFAPAAAHLANGLRVERVGPSLDPSGLVALEVPSPVVEARRASCQVLNVDRYGNLELNLRWSDLAVAGLDGEMTLEARLGGRTFQLERARTFGEVPEGSFALLLDSAGWLAVVMNGGSAAGTLEADVGARMDMWASPS